MPELDIKYQIFEQYNHQLGHDRQGAGCEVGRLQQAREIAKYYVHFYKRRISSPNNHPRNQAHFKSFKAFKNLINRWKKP